MSSSSSTTRTLSPTAHPLIGRRLKLKRLPRRQGERKGTSLTPRSFHPDLAPVHLHESLGDSQAKARSFGFFFALLSDLIELRKDFICLFRENPWTRVCNGDPDPFIAILLNGYSHLTLLRGKLDCITNEVHQYLSDLVSIRPGFNTGIMRENLKIDQLIRCYRPQAFCNLLD